MFTRFQQNMNGEKNKNLSKWRKLTQVEALVKYFKTLEKYQDLFILTKFNKTKIIETSRKGDYYFKVFYIKQNSYCKKLKEKIIPLKCRVFFCCREKNTYNT